MADYFSLLAVPGVCFFLALVNDVAAGGDFCYTTEYGYTRLEYCRYGCCGTFDTYCCNISVGVIAGAVVGAIVSIGLIVALICCCVKKQSYRGRVVGPHGVAPGGGGGNVTVVHSNMASMGPHPPPMVYPQPAPYMQPGQPGFQPPPPYFYSNPAYPPPPGAGPGTGWAGGTGGFAAPAAPAYAPTSAGP